jgi:hypothetical protein
MVKCHWGFGWEMEEKNHIKGLSDQGNEGNRKNWSDLSEKARQTATKQLNNGSARIVTKRHQYFIDLSDIQMTAIVSMDSEALPMTFWLVETPATLFYAMSAASLLWEHVNYVQKSLPSHFSDDNESRLRNPHDLTPCSRPPHLAKTLQIWDRVSVHFRSDLLSFLSKGRD